MGLANLEARSGSGQDGRHYLQTFFQWAVFAPIILSMTKLLEQALEAVRQLPAESQDDIARTILHLAAAEAEAQPVDPAHLAAVLEGLAQARRREYATDAEIEAAFRRFDR